MYSICFRSDLSSSSASVIPSWRSIRREGRDDADFGCLDEIDGMVCGVIPNKNSYEFCGVIAKLLDSFRLPVLIVFTATS